MGLPVILDPAAESEFDEAIAYLERERPGSGHLFFEAISTRFGRIAEHPYAGKLIRGGARRYVVPGWRYSIIYSVEPDHIFIAAIAHQSRRPNYWRRRLR